MRPAPCGHTSCASSTSSFMILQPLYCPLIRWAQCRRRASRAKHERARERWISQTLCRCAEFSQLFLKFHLLLPSVCPLPVPHHQVSRWPQGRTSLTSPTITFSWVFLHRVNLVDLKEKDIIPWLQQNKSFSWNLECAVVFQAGSCLYRAQGLLWLSPALGKHLPAGKVQVNKIKMNPEPKRWWCCFYPMPCLFVAIWSSSGGISDIFLQADP